MLHKKSGIDFIIDALMYSIGETRMKSQQFFKDKKPWPEGVYSHKTIHKTSKGKIIETVSYRIDTPDGIAELKDGDWVVQTLDNTFYYVRMEDEKTK